MFFGNDINIVSMLLNIPAALIALTVHEYCHGYVAYRLGDPTARSLGRLSLNPLKHLDPIGTLFMILFGFGYAKPVPINPRYFKDPRKGMALTAAAGPISNLLLAFLGALLYRLTLLLLPIVSTEFLLRFILILASFFAAFHYLNLSLCVFNMIPLPPLDGSRILYIFLPPRLYFRIMKYERVIMIILLAALWLGAFSGLINVIVNAISDGMLWLISLLIP
ncbi:MAG: site-2 protease family protein [Clostridia bacterium]|nr:site-2 protease family protein [Clostridia bacterium]